MASLNWNLKGSYLHIATIVWVNICRFLLATVFTFSGFVKAVDPIGFQYKIQDYLIAFGFGHSFPESFQLGVAILFAALEFSIGIFLFLGIRKMIGPLLALLLMLVMTPLTLYLAVYNPVSDCGCFGDAWVLTNWESFIKNIVLLLAALSLFRWRKLLFRFVSADLEWLASLYTVLFVCCLSVYCIKNLPIIDFRPYKIGRDIWAGMQIPEGAKPDVYESFFTLEKNGVRKEFTLDNYPDSTWTFIDSRSILKEKGYEPPIHDFSLKEVVGGNDITENVLTDMGYTFLLVTNRLEESDDSHIDLINEIYDYSVENKYRFYALTSSSSDQIEGWRDRTGAEYPFCQVDNITLKTMLRSNPGLILIKNGKIINKWSDRNIPDEYVLTDRLEKLPLGKQKSFNDWDTIGYVVLWFFVPLFVVLGLDILFIRRHQWKARKEKSRQQVQAHTDSVSNDSVE